MIRVEPTTTQWVHANFATDKAIDGSIGVWRVLDNDRVAFVIGILRPSLLGWAELWLVPAHVTKRALRNRRGLIALLREHFPCVSAHARGAANERFARFFGFKPIGTQVVDGETWTRFELT